MSLLSFRSPAYYAACHHCGNALQASDNDCPNCGASQSRALTAPNAMAFNNRNYLAVPSRMLVSYPSVPEEVDTALNIARQRARKFRRAAFGVTLGAMVAGALALAYGPGMRSASVMRLAAQPEPVPAPAVDVTKPLDVAPSVTVAEGSTDYASSDPALAASKAAVGVAVIANAPPVAKAPASAQAENHAALVQTVQTPPAASQPAQLAQVPAVPAALPAAEIKKPVVVAQVAPKPVQAASAKPLVNLDALKPFTFITPALRAQALSTLALAEQTVTSKAAQIERSITDVIASRSSTPDASEQTMPVTQSAAVTLPAFPVPEAPEPTADVPLASHSAQLAEPVIVPPSPVAVAAARPAAGTPAESLYLAKLALSTNDLSAARKNLAALPADQAGDEQTMQVREELAHREGARDAAMLRARACDSTGSLSCARKSAKEAVAIDTSYGDARLFLKRVYAEAAQAKKARENAPVQMANSPVEAKASIEPYRDLNSTSRLAESGAINPGAVHGAPIGHVPPIRETHDTRDAREIREARIELDILEARNTRLPVREVSAPVLPPPDSLFSSVEPIRPAGRGDAH